MYTLLCFCSDERTELCICSPPYLCWSSVVATCPISVTCSLAVYNVFLLLSSCRLLCVAECFELNIYLTHSHPSFPRLSAIFSHYIMVCKSYASQHSNRIAANTSA
ncbi:hypothetical protein NEOLEDRAFT_149876 [Neolentinus lepideus HHB14362 ss-1]|uniref:Uncharacterized protein n=1 Tax=Neolentinus lepideus HHB14362 ss-1 TaxID=1314782 RepID=A0A165MNK1_9AGAM|nr:hypothetical protein NEOLEDRAFT_149876 [Neolentinus lepideus HHB14362 ss-1]